MIPLVSASILSADWGRLREELAAVEEAGVDWIHVDVMDGHFVPNITFGPKFVETLRGLTTLPLDVHLMIENPEKYVDSFIKAGSDIITVHAESSHHLHRLIQNIKEKGVQAGVALNPATSLNVLEWIIDDIDLVLLMTVNPGFGGQQFIPSMLDKISKFKSSHQKRLSIDGGVNDAIVKEIDHVDILVVGSYLFEGGKNYQEKIKLLKNQ
jgi:ribulose-phosphate 3-epimerase